MSRPAPGPRVFDVAVAAALFAVTCLAGIQYHPEGWPRFDWFAYTLTALACLPLALRRRTPVLAFAVCTTAFTGYLLAGYQPSINYWGPLLGLYSVAALRPFRTAAACATVTAIVLSYTGISSDTMPVELSLTQGLVMAGLAWAFGANVRKLATAKARLEREQQERTARAVTDERVRIARELHDVVAHHMSVISVQAGLAGYVFTSDPPTAREALATISSTSREALDEMRRLLAVLRLAPDENGELGPAPGLDGLRELVAGARAAGLPAGLEITGTPRQLPPGLELCVYRVVQEALTNVLKHARPTEVAVTVDYGSRDLVVRVTNDGPVDTATGVGEPGHGLIGMRERARLYQGAVTARHRATGGFEVELTLPVPEPR